MASFLILVRNGMKITIEVDHIEFIDEPELYNGIIRSIKKEFGINAILVVQNKNHELLKHTDN